MCPVLSFTPEVEGFLELFEMTHEIVVTVAGTAYWRLARMPAPGDYSEQDAHTMLALDHVRRISDDALRVQFKKHQQEAEAKAKAEAERQRARSENHTHY